MLYELHIENYAIIDHLDLNLDKGLTVLTGETGAGKSIMLGALSLILGKRADTSVLFDKSKKSIIEAKFLLADNAFKSWFDANDLDFDRELIIRREISHAGKSRAFINDTPSTLSVLSELSNKLIDIHQQFDTREIFETSFQRQILDGLAGNDSLLEKYQSNYKKLKALESELRAAKESLAKASTEQDFIKFQLNELNEANFVSGEQKSSEEELNRLNNAEGIKSATQSAYYALEESEQSISTQLDEIVRQLSTFQDVDEDMKSLFDKLESCREDLRDLSQSLSNYGAHVDFDQNRIDELSERLELIYKLQSKHRVNSVEELIEIQKSLDLKVSNNDSLESKISSLEGQIKNIESELRQTGKALHNKRVLTAPKLEKSVNALLGDMSMKNARLNVELREVERLLPDGTTEIEFLFAANLGSELLPLKQVASGGETSRLALCLKSTIADVVDLPTMIFDEIDAGVSGEVALKMGEILRKMSENHQIITITHSAQIASKGQEHFFIYKEDSTNRTFTKVKSLDAESRLLEIAKMLSGNPPSKAAIENAKSLLR